MSENFRLDTSDSTTLAAGTPKPLIDPVSGTPRFDREGNLISGLDVIFIGNTTETIKVRSIAIEPSITAGVPIELKGASVRPWRFNGKTGVTFYADAIDVKGSSSSNKTSN